MSRAKENASLASRLRAGIGGLVTSDVDSLETIPVGSDGQVLTADSTDPNGIKWATPGASGLTGPQITDLTDAGDSALHYHATDRALANATGSLAIANGGTGTTTRQAAIDALTAASSASAGQVLTSDGTNATFQTPSGAGIGDVSGPASSIDANLPSFSGTGGKTIQDSGIAASNVATLTGTQTLTNKTIGSGSSWNGTAIAPTLGGTGQTSFAKGDILFASATNTVGKLPIGTLGQNLVVNASGVPSWSSTGGTDYIFVVDATYGNGVADASAAIQAKIALAQAAGGGHVIIPQGTYIINATLTLPSYVTLSGQGMEATTLKLKTGANQNVITTTSTSSLVSGATSGGAKYWGVRDLTINGNRAGNSAGHGIYTYGRAYFLKNLRIEACKQSGVWSRWGTTGVYPDSMTDYMMESHIDTVLIQDCGQYGLYYDGPHDGMITGVIAALNSRTTDGTYDGIYVGSRAGGTQFDKCHSWGDTHKYDYNVNSNYIYFTNCVADDARTALVYINGTHVSWVGGHAFGAIWNSPPLSHDLTMKGFVLTANAWHPFISTLCSNAPGGAVDFTSAPNGSGTIIVSGDMASSLNTYGTTYGYVGTPPANLNVQINIFLPENNASYFTWDH